MVRRQIKFTLDTATIYTQNNDHSQHYILCAWWVFDATPDLSCCLPACPMGVSSPPLLLINCLSYPPRWASPPPPQPPPMGWPHFPQGPRIHPLPCPIQLWYEHPMKAPRSRLEAGWTRQHDGRITRAGQQHLQHLPRVEAHSHYQKRLRQDCESFFLTRLFWDTPKVLVSWDKYKRIFYSNIDPSPPQSCGVHAAPRSSWCSTRSPGRGRCWCCVRKVANVPVYLVVVPSPSTSHSLH